MRDDGDRVPDWDRARLLCVGLDLKNGAEAWREAAQPWVTAGELARARRFHHRIDGTRHLVGRAVVRSLLGRAGGAAVPAEFTVNPWGKPAWPGCGFEFSISHSGDAIWVAFCRDAAVGIDVEAPSAAIDPQALAASLHPAERAELAGLADPEARTAFLRCWVRKEATLKALGEGLARPLSSFRVRTDARSRDWLAEAPQVGTASWTTADLRAADGYQVSVAATAPGLSVACRRLEQLRSDIGLDDFFNKTTFPASIPI